MKYFRCILAVTLGAGVQFHEAFDFVEKHGRFIVGGSPTVGAAGGWVMGGGHGSLSPSFGLGKLPVFPFVLLILQFTM
jgi:FAD/FMN-containing dehydrogenase